MADTDTRSARPLPPKPVDLDLIEQGYQLILRGLGQQEKAEVMANTPRRCAELWNEMINAPGVDIEDVFKTFQNPGGDDMIIVNDVHYVSVCEHHLALAFGVAQVAYIPDELVVGYSKLKKGLNYVARQPQLNERLIFDVADIIEDQLNPKGVAIVTQSVHCCIAQRTNAPMQEIVTIGEYRGLMRDDPYRRDFTASWQGRKPLFLGA